MPLKASEGPFEGVRSHESAASRGTLRPLNQLDEGSFRIAPLGPAGLQVRETNP